MSNPSTVADALREAITRGWLDVDAAIEWARQEALVDREVLDPLIPYLARSEHRPTSHILLILTQLAWGADPSAVGRVAAAQLHQRLTTGELDVRAAVNALMHLLRDGYAPDEAFDGAVRRFDDDLAAAERSGTVPAKLRSSVSSFLRGYAAPAPAPEEPRSDERDHLTLAVEQADDDSLALSVHLEWRGWGGLARVRVLRDALDGFAAQLRDLALHASPSVSFDSTDEAGGRLELTAREYGRARRAALAVHIVDASRDTPPSRPPTELRVALPTEHELLGDFAADLSELAATGDGLARLRLLRRWAG